MVRMLIADDSSAIQKVIRIAFTGFQVISDEAFSLPQALSWLGKQSYDLIILDVNLPGLKGENSLNELKDKAKQAKFILLAGSYDDFNEALYQKLGFQNFLRKPFDAHGLITQVRSLLGPQFSPIAASNDQEAAKKEAPEAISQRDRTIELIDVGRKGRKAFEGSSSKESLNTQMPSELATAVKPNTAPKTIKLSELDLGKKDFIVDSDPPRNEKEPPIFEMPAAQEYRGKIDWHELEDKIHSLGESLIRQELSGLIRQEIQKYFQDHFHNLARQILTEEIRRLASERQQFMEDS